MRLLRNLPLMVRGLIGPGLLVGATVLMTAQANSSLEGASLRLGAVKTDVIVEMERTAGLVAGLDRAHLETLRLINWASAGVGGDTLSAQATRAAAASERLLTLATEAHAAVSADAAADDPTATLLGKLQTYDAAAAQARDMAAIDPSLAVMFLNEADGAHQAISQTLAARGDAVKAATAAQIDSFVANDAADRQTFLIVAGVVVALAVAIALLAQLSVTRPISRMTAAMRSLAQGVTDAPIPDADLTNELGRMAQALTVFRDAAVEQQAMRVAEAETAQATAARAAAAERLQGDLSDALRRVGAGDFSSRMASDYGYDEMNGIAHAVNSVAMTLAQGFADVQSVLSALANADLSQRMRGDYTGAFAQLSDDANATGEKLSGLVARIREASQTSNTASDEIAAGSRDLSARAEQQAASLEEIAATMEEMSATIKQNADRAAKAAALSQQASSAAGEGRDVAGQAVTAIRDIENSAQKIGEIVDVIESIALQTNLLALNASVEAARAGEAGRGFAVVAAEVRGLAQRSSDAARDIGVLIAESGERVSAGVRHVGATETALSAILGSVESLGDVVADIAQAGREQGSASEEIAASVQQLDQITQQNAALADRSAKSADQLSVEIGGLDELISAFRTEQRGGVRIAA